MMKPDSNEQWLLDLCDQIKRERDTAIAQLKELGYELGEKPKTGHWIGQKQIGFGEWKECLVPLKDGYVTESCHCSECGEWLTASDEYACNGRYCPNCGAKMESEG